MIKLETIKENFPHMIRFAPVSMVVALVLMLFGNLLILNVDIIDSLFHKEENFFKLLVLLGMSFFIFAWLHYISMDSPLRGRWSLMLW